LWLLLGIVCILPAILIPLSWVSPIAIALSISVRVLPWVCFLSVVATWALSRSGKHTAAFWVSWLPAANLLLAVVALFS